MKIGKILAFYCLIGTMKLSAQHEGDQWVIGYGNGFEEPGFGVMSIDFKTGYPSYTVFPFIKFYLNGTVSNICNRFGNPIIVTNGMEITNMMTPTVTDTLAYDADPYSYWNYWNEEGWITLGFGQPDGAIILPVPNRDDVFSIIYHNSEIHPPGYWQPSKILEARVQLINDTNYSVLYKDKLVVPTYKWFTGPIKAVRHANGRDWWVIFFKENSAYYYAMLVTEQGIHLHHESEIDSIVLEGLGQAVFSNNGNYFARMDAVNSGENGQFITLYSFDRCSGYLERMHTFQEDGGFFSGVSFSPSEQYLYAGNNYNLWQWDLFANEIASSKTLVDSFDGFMPPNWFSPTFGSMVNAPDGRIYMISDNASSRYFHVIDRPDMPAMNCKFLQHSIELPVSNGRSAPNIPNYRLGPLDGSPCDTLGIDNHPVAWWRHEPDTEEDIYTIRFTDLSYFDPQTWHWDFDDGYTSEEESPLHTFDPGIYEVCLTVSNANSSDTLCKQIEILTTAVHDQLALLPDLSINPNPFNDQLIIKSRSSRIRLVEMHIYDIHGREVFGGSEVPVPVTINLPSLSPGIYFTTIIEQDGEVYNFKVVKN